MRTKKKSQTGNAPPTTKNRIGNGILREGWRTGTLALLLSVAFAVAGCDSAESFSQAVDTTWNKVRRLIDGPEQPRPRTEPVVSMNGGERFVAFESSTSYLVEGDTNNFTDVFVHDRQTNQNVRVSVKSGGGQANGGSFAPDVTPDGRLAVFESLATNLVPDDTNRQRDVFLHDRRTGQTVRVSVDSRGGQANNFSQSGHISADGRYIVFESLASNLVPGDTNGVIDIFLHDRLMKRTTRVSVASDGTQADNPSVNPSLSADGRYITFESFATNLTKEKFEPQKHTYVHDRLTGRTTAVSTDGPEQHPSVSHLAKGTRVAKRS